MKYIYTICLLCLTSTITLAQLGSFTISVEPTPETCNKNGILSITTEGVTNGTTIVYSIYKMPDETTAIKTTDSNTVIGLGAGDYKVVATQSSVNYSNYAVAEASIKDNTIELIYNIENVEPETCGNDGGFTINVTSGTAPYEYQILDAENNVVLSQSDSKFIGLSTGKYKVRVNDACGVGRVKEVEVMSVENPTGYLTMLTYNNSCARSLQIVFNNSLDYANFSYELSYIDPNTGENITLNSENNSFRIEAFSNKQVTYNYKVKNKCGVVLSGQRTINYPNLDREITSYENLIGSSSCGNSFGFIVYTKSVEPDGQSKIEDIVFTEVPVGVDVANIDYKLDVNAVIGSEGNALAEGIYKGFLITCAGQELPFEYNYKENTDFNNSIVAEGTDIWYSTCDTKSQSFGFRATSNISSVTPVNPPAGSDYGLYTYGTYVEIYVYNYPPGEYEFEITNVCGVTQTVTITVVPQEDFSSGEVNVEYVCGGFNIKEIKKPYSPDLYARFVQIYDETLGGWTTPKTDIERELYTESDLANLYYAKGKAFYLDSDKKDAPNLQLENNFQFNGKFRILERNRYFKYNKTGGKEYLYCSQVINEFEVTENAVAIEAYSFSCNNGNYTVAVNGKNGIEPFTYQIVKDPDSSTVDNIIVNNEQSHLFTNLSSGEYYFRAIDACGNYNTVKYSIANLGVPKIIQSANCNTQELTLELQGLEYLNFQWYKEEAPNNILSTSSALELGSISLEETGKYFVHITSQDTGTCIDKVLEVTVNPDPFDAPIAGQDFTVGPIESSNPINLQDLLTQNNTEVSLTGNFEFIYAKGQTPENSGTIVDNVWYPEQAREGIYQIKYVVNGLCGQNDEAIITIINRNICVKSPSTTPSTGTPPIGISTLHRMETLNNWLGGYNNGWIALESRTKGFVITRADDVNHPENIADPVEGMLVFDIDENCLKLYNGTQWGCIYRGCDDQR